MLLSDKKIPSLKLKRYIGTYNVPKPQNLTFNPSVLLLILLSDVLLFG